jgi:hypothetical protein
MALHPYLDDIMPLTIYLGRWGNCSAIKVFEKPDGSTKKIDIGRYNIVNEIYVFSFYICRYRAKYII